ncbi:MAG: hypothetical protein HS111_10135 [Kofleriaceae bacterium]|nr:hypothetical protein [Kofleriaceae bacterium]
MPPGTGIAAESARKQWSEAALVAELRQLHARGVRITSRDLLSAGESKVLGAIARLLGSIERARELARLPELVVQRPSTPARWSTAKVLHELRRRHIAGLPLASSRVPPNLRDAAITWFGSWQRAIEDAGLDYAATRVKPLARTKRQVGKELRELARKEPTMSRARLRTHEVGVAAIRRYGSLDQALEAAGITAWPRRRRRDSGAPRVARLRPPEERRTLSRAETEKALRRRDAEGRSVAESAMQRDDPDLMNAIRRHFGSINIAREAIGLAPHYQRWTVERVTTELRARHKAGKSMAPEAILREEPALYRAIWRRLGSVGAAIARVVPEAEDAPIRDERRVLAMIRLRKRKGLSLEKADVPSRLRAGAQRLFGTWQKALAAAGLDIDEELSHRTWTDEELLAAMRALAAEKPAMTVSELHRSRLGSTASKRFGTLAAALRLAGLTRWPRRLHRALPGRDDVLRLLRQRHSRGDVLSMPATRRDEPRLVKAALKHFGKWNAALAAAGVARVGAAGPAT